jgi:cytoskeletal protein CcmA (bactofilin family)
MAFSISKSRSHSHADIADKDTVGFLEPSVEVEGKIAFSAGILRVNSHIKGEIRCAGTIIVGEQGDIEAEVQTKSVSIAGKLKGSIHASERIEIKEHGVVLGEIDTPCLIVEPGGYFSGACHMPTPGAPLAELPELTSDQRPHPGN